MAAPLQAARPAGKPRAGERLNRAFLLKSQAVNSPVSFAGQSRQTTKEAESNDCACTREGQGGAGRVVVERWPASACTHVRIQRKLVSELTFAGAASCAGGANGR